MINNCLGSLRGGVPNASHKTFCFVLKKVFAMQNTRRAICPKTVESSDVRAPGLIPFVTILIHSHFIIGALNLLTYFNCYFNMDTADGCEEDFI